MSLLYRLGIYIYYVMVLLATTWNDKARKWIRGRQKWAKQIEGIFDRNDQVIWFHCASLGEFEQGRPLIERVRHDHPEYKILLTFFSPSGYEKRKDYKGVDHVSYLPLDTPGNARKLLQILAIEKVFFIKYEFWYFILKALGREGIPVYLASGNFRSDQLFFKWYGRWYRKFLSFFTQIFVQTAESKQLLHSIGIQQVSVAGDTRFERVLKIARDAVNLENLDSFSSGKEVIIAGSTWEKDESLLYEVYKRMPGKCKWIIAPHEPTERNILRLSQQFSNCVLFSEIRDGSQIDAEVILVDTIGHLSSLYQYGNLAYIGGGFGKGIHNILEAAAFGNALIFGPNFQSFQEAKDLISCRVAYVVEHFQEAYIRIEGLVNSEDERKSIAQTAENYILSRSGATDKIVDYVFINPA